MKACILVPFALWNKAVRIISIRQSAIAQYPYVIYFIIYNKINLLPAALFKHQLHPDAHSLVLNPACKHTVNTILITNIDKRRIHVQWFYPDTNASCRIMDRPNCSLAVSD